MNKLIYLKQNCFILNSQMKKNESSIFDELNFHDSHAIGDIDNGVDITGVYILHFLADN